MSSRDEIDAAIARFYEGLLDGVGRLRGKPLLDICVELSALLCLEACLSVRGRRALRPVAEVLEGSSARELPIAGDVRAEWYEALGVQLMLARAHAQRATPAELEEALGMFADKARRAGVRVLEGDVDVAGRPN